MLRPAKSKQKPRSKTQVLEVVEDAKGNRFWHSDVVGWVPQEVIEMPSRMFLVGTRITVEYSVETVQPTSA